MTQKRYDQHGTEFGSWLREQPAIDSKLGFVASNIDYIWHNYKTGEWMLIEEKRYGTQVKLWQRQIFAVIHKAAKSDPNYKGIHLIVFENTSPDDGLIWLDHQLITKDQLLAFLRFE